MKEIVCKVLVIGAGPGGYVCAIRAGQLGLDTVIVDAGPIGGTCLNVGCIPSKAVIHVADEFHRMHAAAAGSPTGIRAGAPTIDFARTLAWKNGIVERLNLGVAGLLKKAGVKTVKGWASFRDGKTVEVTTETGVQVIRAEAIVIATGSRAAEFPALPFGDAVVSSTEALALDRVPASLAVVGGGYIGLELGTAFAKLGARVSVIESAATAAAAIRRRTVRTGVGARTGTRHRRPHRRHRAWARGRRQRSCDRTRRRAPHGRSRNDSGHRRTARRARRLGARRTGSRPRRRRHSHR